MTGFPEWGSFLIIGAVCTFYTFMVSNDEHLMVHALHRSTKFYLSVCIYMYTRTIKHYFQEKKYLTHVLTGTYTAQINFKLPVISALLQGSYCDLPKKSFSRNKKNFYRSIYSLSVINIKIGKIENYFGYILFFGRTYLHTSKIRLSPEKEKKIEQLTKVVTCK